jgi:hypothetical protein
VPKLQKRRRSPGQTELGLDATDGLSTTEQEYKPIPVINEIRGYVAAWRNCRTPEPRRTSEFDRDRSAITLLGHLQAIPAFLPFLVPVTPQLETYKPKRLDLASGPRCASRRFRSFPEG